MNTQGERDELRSTSSRGTRVRRALARSVSCSWGCWGCGGRQRTRYGRPSCASCTCTCPRLARVLGVHHHGLGSAMFLWKRSVWWDLIAGASAEIGVCSVHSALATCRSGADRPGVRTGNGVTCGIVTTLVLLLMYAPAISRYAAYDGDPTQRSKTGSDRRVIAAGNIPVVRFSVDWWSNRTLHQKDTVGLDTKLDNFQLFTLMFGLVVFTIIFSWMLLHRFRIAWLESETEQRGLEQALIERRAEGRPLGAAEVRP